MLSLEIFKKVIDQVYSSKPFIEFTGGEPLLHPDILECLSYAKKKGLYCGLRVPEILAAPIPEILAYPSREVRNDGIGATRAG
jgi:organic radical activating enzyme